MDANIKVNPLKYPSIECECGSIVWNHGVIIKKILGIAMGMGNEPQYVDLPIFYCAKCGKILPEYEEMYKLGESSNEDSGSLIIK